MSDRLISAVSESGEEAGFERAMRPRTLAEYVGQPTVSAQMEIFVGAARERQEPWTTP